MSEYFDFLGIENASKLKNRGITVNSRTVTDSTSADARKYAADGSPAPALFVANSQSAGRGRLGRSFFSPADTGIYMTLLLEAEHDKPYHTAHLTSAAAVAVATALQKYCPHECKIKWVNDIYADGKKVCGILAESFFAGEKKFIAIGVGVNVGKTNFPDELRAIAGSLGASATADVRRALTVSLAAGLFDIYKAVFSGDYSYMEEYRRRSLVLGKEVMFTQNGITQSATAVSIADDGALLVILPDNRQIALQSGEISLRIK